MAVQECPQCFRPLPSTRAKFCPHCGATLPERPITEAPPPKLLDTAPREAPFTKPIRLEKRGSLLNPFFLISVGMVLGGTLLAGEGQLRLGTLLLLIGLPALLITTVRSLVR